MAPPESHSSSSVAAEQAEALAQVAAIVENSDDAIIGKTLDGVIRSWNTGAQRLFTLLVAVTGWGQSEDRRRAYEAGFDHHLAKPVAAEAIESILRCLGPGNP